MTIKAKVLASLDRVADFLEKKGHKKAATELDKVANTLQAAVPDTEPGNPSDEAARGDPLSVSESQYHDLPLGADNVSEEVFGMTTPSSTNPEFATKDPISIESARKVAETGDLRKLTSFPLSEDVYDLGSPEGGLATTDLPESGGSGSKALDDDQKGQPIPPMRTRPSGTVHAALIENLRGKKEALITACNNGVIGKDQAVANWKAIVAAFNVEMGKSDKAVVASSSILERVPPPKMVPRIAYPLWEAAVRTAARDGKLITASKQVNRPAAIKAYVSLLEKLAMDAGG